VLQQRQRKLRELECQRDADSGERGGLGGTDENDPPSRRAQGRPDREFGVPLSGSRRRQHDEIQHRDQQKTASGREERLRARPRTVRYRRRETLRRQPHSRFLGLHAAAQCRKSPLQALNRLRRTKANDGSEQFDLSRERRRKLVRDVDVHVAEIVAERREDTDDRARAAVHRDSGADHLSTSEQLIPEPIGQHDDSAGARLLLLASELTSCSERNPERRKVTG